MHRWRPELGLIQETLLLTLRARALDAQQAGPILGDTLSADLAGRIDYDFARLKVKPGLVVTTALRAKMLDGVVRAFVAAHPGCVVLDLGCGLDARMSRCDLALNGYTRFAAWAMKYHPAIKALGIKAAQGFDDPCEPESWDAGLELVEEQILTRAPEVARFPQPLRALTRLTARSTALSRQGARVLRYRF